MLIASFSRSSILVCTYSLSPSIATVLKYTPSIEAAALLPTRVPNIHHTYLFSTPHVSV